MSMFAWLAVAASLGAARPAAAVPELEVNGGLACPSRALLAREIAAALADVPAPLLGKIIVAAHGDAVAPARVRLRFVEPAGRVPVDRVIEVEPARCATTARAIALVLERHARALAWSGAPPPPAPAVRDESSVRGTAIGTGPAHGGQAPRLLVLVGASLASGTGVPSAALEARSRVAGPVSFGLGVALPTTAAHEPLPNGGEARLTGAAARARVVAERPWRSVLWLGGLDVELASERGEARAIEVPGAGRRLLLSAGATVGVAWRATARLRLGLEVTALRPLLGPDFEVRGHGRVLMAPGVAGALGVRAGWALWP